VNPGGAQRSSRPVVSAALVTVGLTVLTALVAMAARSPLSSSAPVNAASARAPTVALFILLLGTGIVALAAIVVLLWPGRGTDEPEFVPARPKVHWIWKALAILLPFALGAALVTAAIVGAKRRNISTLVPRGLAGTGLVAGSNGRSAAARPSGSGFVLPTWLPWTLIAIAAMALAVAIVVFLMRRKTAVDEPPDRDAARSAVQAAIGALDTAQDPRAAVIAAYRAMERTFAAHGLARSPTEAPREYLARMLAVRSATDGEASTLTNLFEEARFSTHPISERVRELALTALQRLRARLGGDRPQ
jgi:hypothetical protein